MLLLCYFFHNHVLSIHDRQASQEMIDSSSYIWWFQYEAVQGKPNAFTRSFILSNSPCVAFSRSWSGVSRSMV